MDEKRYILKRDLPLFKAGAECRITKKGNLASGDAVLYTSGQLKAHPEILREWFDEIALRPRTVMDLKPGDKCWYIDGGIYEAYWEDDIESLQDCAVGNVYLTKLAATLELYRRRAREVILRDAKGFVPDVGDATERKWYVYYDIELGELECLDTAGYIEEYIYFAQERDAERSIKQHRAAWLVYLGLAPIQDMESLHKQIDEALGLGVKDE